MRQVRAACKALSPCDAALLQLVDCSSEAAVWCAAALLVRHPRVCVDTQAATSVLLMLLTGTVKAGDAAPRDAQERATHQPLRQLTQQLVRLVPAMLLRCAARATDPAQQGLTSPNLHAVLRHTHLPDPGQRLTSNGPRGAQPSLFVDEPVNLILQPAWAQQTAGCSSAGAGSSRGSSSTAGSAAGTDSSSVWLQPHLPAVWLQQVFADAHAICSACVTKPAASSTAATLVILQTQLLSRAAEAPTVSNSSSNGSSSTSQPLSAPLAAFRGVVLQTYASFDGFARSTARRIAADPQAATVDARKAASSITSTCLSKDGSSRPGPLLALVQPAGPGSREQQALYSCLCSVAKLGAVAAAPGSGVGQWGHLLFRVARVALLLLELQASGGAEQGSTGSNSGATAASASTQPPAPAATVSLPSLVLLGRCVQSWAHQLQDIVPSLQQLHSTGADPLQARRLRSELAPEQCPVTCVFFSPGPGPSSTTRFERLVLQWLGWLADSDSSMQQLAAAAYSVLQLPPMLQGLLAAQTATQYSLEGEGGVKIACADLQAELEAVGAALTALATSAFCNNPACQNVSGPTELSLVSGRSCLCGGCCVARYCSRACQRAQWAQHKPVCKALAAAAMAAAAGTAPAAGAGSMG